MANLYFEAQAAPVAGARVPDVWVSLKEDPLRPGELMLEATAGVVVRVRLDESSSGRLADALGRWYADRSEVEAVRNYQGDTVIQYRDGLRRARFSADPEV